MRPYFKVNVGGEDYENTLFTKLVVKLRENNYNSASLTCTNTDYAIYGDAIERFDELKVYMKQNSGDAYSQPFGGYVTQLTPYRVQEGPMLITKCKGYGVALEATHVKTEYGTETPNSTKDTCKEIWQDIVTNYVNKSLGTATNTEWAIDNTKIVDFENANTISALNLPFTTCMDAVNLLCDVGTAIADGSAGPHWIVDTSKQLIIDTIGNHTYNADWTTWLITDEAHSDITNYTFLSFNTIDSVDQYANKCVVVSDMRKPLYDIWTQSSALWNNNALSALGTDTGVIGNSIKYTQNGVNTGYAEFPSGKNAGWDVTKWGTTRTIPTISFYWKKDSNWDAGESASTGGIFFCTDANNYYYPTSQIFSINDPVGEWVVKRVQIGEYAVEPEWSKGGVGANPDWADINWVAFSVSTVLGTGSGIGWIDDMHFTGQIARSAFDSDEITDNKEWQKVFISRYALDDSCVATDDTGTCARIAYAELLRRKAIPYTIVFTVELQPTWRAGQKFKINGITFRTTEIVHTISGDDNEVAQTQVSATTDLLNTHPICGVDQWSILRENILTTSKDAKDIRAGSEVDARLEPIETNYA